MLCADDVPRGLEVSDRSANFLGRVGCGHSARLGRTVATHLGGSRWRGTAAARRRPPGNLIAARGDEMMWLDFEDVSLGPPEWISPR